MTHNPSQASSALEASRRRTYTIGPRAVRALGLEGGLETETGRRSCPQF